MNAPFITPAPPSVSELLTAIINAKRLIDASGDLGNAPTDLLNALDAGDDAARELLEWLGNGERSTWPRAGGLYRDFVA